MLPKIIVPIKRVVDYSARIRIKSDRSGIETDGIKMSLNPFDEVSLEQAVKMKEKGGVKEILSVTLGTQMCQESLRQALAFGVDRAVHIETNSNELEPFFVAKVLSKFVEKEKAQLVMLGKQAIDDDFCQTGQILAGILDWPQATFISQLEIINEGKCIKLARETDYGVEFLETTLPAVLTTDLRLNKPRFLSIQSIMKSKKKVIEKINLEEIGIFSESKKLKIISVDEPSARKPGVIVGSVDELVDNLRKIGSI